MPAYELSTPAQHPVVTLVNDDGTAIALATSYNTSVASSVAEPLDPERLAIGEATLHRRWIGSASITLSSGTFRLSYFTARKTETVTQLRLISGTTAAGATPTLIRVGIYSVDDSGNSALVGSIANDTSIFAATSTTYTRPLTTPFVKTAGMRYAVGILVVTAATAPTVVGYVALNAAEAGTSPRLNGVITGRADLPETIAAAGDTTFNPYVVLLP